MKSILQILIIIISCVSTYAQSINNGNETLEIQFNNVYKVSNSYEKYKIIKKVYFQDLKLNALDSLKKYKKLLSNNVDLLNKEEEKLKKLKKQLEESGLALIISLEKENKISLFGLVISKISYNLFLWIIIIILISGLLYFIFKFKDNEIVTKKTKKKLIDIEFELQQQRKQALLKEQKLRRQLQDEIIKQRGS